MLRGWSVWALARCFGRLAGTSQRGGAHSLNAWTGWKLADIEWRCKAHVCVPWMGQASQRPGNTYWRSCVVAPALQVLHYKIESMRERVSYLRSIGMTAPQVAAAVCRFPQLFSLSVESNLAPKWRYLVEHLGGDVATLCAYPGYFSLSLSNRWVGGLLVGEHGCGRWCCPT